MSTMFFWNKKLKTIYVSEYNEEKGWTTSNVNSSGNMFAGCGNIIGGNGTTWNGNYTDATYARIDTEGEPGYFTNIKDKPIEEQ